MDEVEAMTAPFVIAYARCSTEKQDLDIQIEALKAAGAGRIFKEKLSGAKEDRPELRKALDALQPGNVLLVYKTDRLARSVRQTVNIVHEVAEKGAHFRSLTEGFDTTTVSGNALFQMIAVFAEMERGMIKARVVDGVRAAQAKGVRFGRKRADHPDHIAKLERAKTLIRGGLSVTEAAGAVGLSRSTVYKYLEDGENGQTQKRTTKKTNSPSDSASQSGDVVRLASFRK
jgi:DNA invertase Pin-like site-specific DNA recombinase